MGRQWYLYLFAIDLFLDLVAIATGATVMRYITKPALVLLLLLYVTFRNFYGARSQRLLQSALFFSWAGDICLLFEDISPVYFLMGLAGFLIGHICYCLFFIWVKNVNRQSRRWNAGVILAVLVYVAALLSLLFPRLGNLRIPVVIYGIILGCMLITAIHAFAVRRQLAGFFCVSGAFLFVMSDSLLAIDRFYTSFFMANFLVMLTYAVAQLFIATGAAAFLTRYSRSPSLQ